METPVSGGCASALPATGAGGPTASVGVDGGVLRYIGQLDDPPTYSYPKVGCSVDLATGASAPTPLDPTFNGWLSGSDDGTYERRAESSATWDPVTQAWWFVGRTTSWADGGYSLALYRHRPTQWADPVSHDLTVTLDGTGTGSVTSDPGGIDCGIDCATSFSGGDEVTLTASAAPGSVFDGWTGGGCSGTGPCVVVMDQDHDVHGSFSEEAPSNGEGLIAFMGTTPGVPSSNLFLLDAEASTSSMVAGTSGASHPAWSSDGTRLAYTSSTGLFIVDRETGVTTTVFDSGTLPTGGPASVSWSPDDQWLLFSASGGTRSDVWVAAVDGSVAPTNLTDSDLTSDGHPTWSPDGHIAWRTTASAARVWTAGFDTEAVALVDPAGLANSTAVPSQQRKMDWSPDGSSLVLAAAVNAASSDDVYLLPTDGVGALHQLTTDPGRDSEPTWSPDGSRILFTSDRSGEFDLHTIPVDGAPGDETLLHHRDGSERSPDWAPPAPAVEPVIRPGGAGVLEGDAGSVTVEVPVTLSAPSAQPVTVQWSTLDTGGAGVATADIDYAAASGTVTFAPGETAATVSITVHGDTEHELPLVWGEWILVSFTNPSANATIDPSFYGLGVGVIFDDDV